MFLLCFENLQLLFIFCVRNFPSHVQFTYNQGTSTHLYAREPAFLTMSMDGEYVSSLSYMYENEPPFRVPWKCWENQRLDICHPLWSINLFLNSCKFSSNPSPANTSMHTRKHVQQSWKGWCCPPLPYETVNRTCNCKYANSTQSCSASVALISYSLLPDTP